MYGIVEETYCQRSLNHWHLTDEICLLLLCSISNDTITYFPFSILSLVNLLFHTSFCWKWPVNCDVFVKWPGSQE